MPTTQFTLEQLQKFFSGKYFHKAFNETTKLSDDLKIHADGDYPEKLIEERRPSESIAVKEYRKKIWKPITKPVVSKVITSLGKIRRSSDWSIKFDVNKIPKSIAIGEGLNDYCEKNFPFFNNLTNWAFGVLLKAYTTDPNALICIYPIQEQAAVNSYLKPFPFIFYSNQVIEYVEGDYAVLKSTDKVLYGDTGHKNWGDVYYIITTKMVQRYEQIKSDRTMQLVWEYQHNLGELPVTKTKGFFKKALDGTFIFDSRLAPMIPRLDEALREYSDLQAEVVQHIFSEKWEYVTDECTQCKGSGKIKAAYGAESNCTGCSGTGNKPRGPYTTLQIKAPMAGEASMPTPPIGYVQKDISIVEIQDKRIDKHIFNALGSINMQFLEQVPMSESGIAKEVDRDELNNFVHSIAEDIVAILDKVVYFISELRYSIVVPNKQERLELLPSIAVPEKFDILSTNYLETELQNAKTNKVNPIIVNALELEYANKKFNNDPGIRDRVALMLALDPLAGISEDDKMVRFSNGWIMKESGIISSNIQDFISRAIDEKGEAFFAMKIKEQKALMLQYAQELVAATSTASLIIDNQPGEGDAASGANNLAQSVGGLTGMIEIAKAVASGLYDLDAAVALVSNRFGITEEEAKRQLGTPNISDSTQQIEKVAKLT